MSSSLTSGGPRRTRICLGQSKHGCLTCKTRRIRCDEGKPICERCVRSNKICRGYSRGLPSLNVQESPGSFHAVPVRGVFSNYRNAQLHDLGLALLSETLYSRFGESGLKFSHLLPQFTLSVASVRAATVVLGAAFQQRNEPSNDQGRKLQLTSDYVLAVKQIQEDLEAQSHGVTPLIIAILLLASAEILLNHFENAHLHLRGAMTVLNHCGTSHCSDIAFLVQAEEVSALTFSMRSPPERHLLGGTNIQMEFSDLKSAHKILNKLLESGYAWATQVFTLKHFPKQQSQEICNEQAQHIARLFQWLSHFSSIVLPYFTRMSSKLREGSSEREHASILRMACLACIVQLSTILSLHESSYDIFLPLFRQIVEHAVLALKERSTRLAQLDLSAISSAARFSFSVGLGIVQPLSLVALKCRNGTLRRKAIACLLRAGFEGPYHGSREAAVAFRAMEQEEAWPASPHAISREALNCLYWVFNPASDTGFETRECSIFPELIHPICEEARISGCRMVFGEADSWLGHHHDVAIKESVQTVFYRCTDVEGSLIQDEETQTYESIFHTSPFWIVWQENIIII